MNLNTLLFEIEFIKVSKALFERQTQNNTVASWAKKLGMTYDELHKVWDKAAEGKGTNYFAIMGTFKKAVTSLEGVTKKQLMAGGNAKFDYKVRTKQSLNQLLDDKPAPKNTNKEFVKKTRTKISDINKEMKELRNKPANTKIRKDRIKKQLDILKSKKKELENTLK